MHLADTSVLINAAHAGPTRDWLRDAAREARVALCDMVAMEYLPGAPDVAEYQAFEQSLRAYPVHDDADYERIAAVTGQEMLRLGRADDAT